MTTTSGQQIKAKREELGLSREQLAEDVGAHPQTIQKIERGDIKKSRFILPIQQSLGMIPEAQGTGATGRRNHRPELRPTDRLDDLPCFVGHPDDAKEFSPMSLRAEPTWQIARPGALHGFNDSYAILVGSNVMAPRFNADETIYIAPHLPPVPGKDVCLRKDLEGGGAMVIIARLEDVTANGWVVRQHSKKNSFTVRRDQYPMCHRILGVLLG